MKKFVENELKETDKLKKLIAYRIFKPLSLFYPTILFFLF